jgi:hypothetical protein
MMEEAIIACPEKYVEEGLTLINRQFRMGSYIFDLLFEDRHGAKLIIELQKGSLDRDHTYQIMDYYDEYKSRNPDQFVELMIVANKIPRERRDRLSSYGIAFKEIPEGQFLSATAPQVDRPKDKKTPQDPPLRETSPEAMPRKGDVFRGKVNDLCQEDAAGWRRRDISFLKHELNRGERFGYPTQKDRIVLKAKDGLRFELNFSKPESDERVCLGTPGRLKQWYHNKGFDSKMVNPDDEVFFEYTGISNEFLIFTPDEYRERVSEGTN